MKIRSLIIMLTLTMLSSTTMGQPENAWVRYFGGPGSEYFHDIYLIPNDGYILTGLSKRLGIDPDSVAGSRSDVWVLKVTNEGELQWQNTYDTFNENGIDRGMSVIDTDDGSFVIGGSTRDENQRRFMGMKIGEDGELIWESTYGGDDPGWCFAVIETKNGEYLFGGYLGGGGQRYGYVVLTDVDGEPIWERRFEQQMIQQINAIREQEDVGFLLAGGAGRDFRLVNIPGEEDIVWAHSYRSEIGSGHCFALVSVAGGYGLAGTVYPGGEAYEGDFRLVRVDENGNQIWDSVYDIDNLQICHSLVRMQDNGFAMIGEATENGSYLPIILRTEPSGEFMWVRTDDFLQTGVYYSGVLDEDDHLLAVGRGVRQERELRGETGIIIKILPDYQAPQIVNFDPDILEFRVLVNDTITFTVQSTDPQEDSLRYVWTVNEDTVSIETSATIIFDELGDVAVKYIVSDGLHEDSISWQVHVSDFYIDSFQPDNLFWRVRRPQEIDFSINARAIDGIDPSYRWLISNRNNQGENDIGEEANLTYTFDLGGEYSLEGRAYHEGGEHSVHWQIEVSSVLWWWNPQARDFSINLNNDTTFTVIPSNPESDSLEYRWLVNGEVENFDEDSIQHTFESLGNHSLTAIVHDGEAVDTVQWTITVVEPVEVNDDLESVLPTEVTLFPAAPNPFNSTTTIRYFLPQSADVRLTVYDSAGRLVHILNDGLKAAGEHRGIIQGEELSAGIYLLRLEVDDDIRSLKVVLLR